MLWEGRGVGAIQVSRSPPLPFTDKELALLKTFADQAVIAIQNARLFNEIQDKSRELEMANKHKSEFLANMSHELRTPLNAIIGFSEVLSEKMFGEVNEKQLEYLLDIHSSGHHLLSLINDILDLSKIEAGRMELDLASFDLPMLLDNCTTLVRERAQPAGPRARARGRATASATGSRDVRKVKQVVINLLSNAVKFTPAGGRVTLRARRLEHAVEIAVVDTGVGIAPDQQALVFEEFRQAGGDYLRKAEGTGLGLSLAKRFVELHGGTMRVESEPGPGLDLCLYSARARAWRRYEQDPDRRGQREEHEAGARHPAPQGPRDARGARPASDGVRLAQRAAPRPRPDGHPAARHRRHRGAARASARTRRSTRSPVIAVSASVMPDDQQKIVALGLRRLRRPSRST